jgi:hypothetical protein
MATSDTKTKTSTKTTDGAVSTVEGMGPANPLAGEIGSAPKAYTDAHGRVLVAAEHPSTVEERMAVLTDDELAALQDAASPGRKSEVLPGGGVTVGAKLYATVPAYFPNAGMALSQAQTDMLAGAKEGDTVDFGDRRAVQIDSGEYVEVRKVKVLKRGSGAERTLEVVE